MIHVLARHGGMCGEHEYYAPLRAAMDPVRGILRSHPVLWRVVGTLIDNAISGSGTAVMAAGRP